MQSGCRKLRVRNDGTVQGSFGGELGAEASLQVQEMGLAAAPALGALLFDAGSVAFAAPCNAAISLTGYPLVAALSMKRPARTPRSSLHAVAASGRARARFGVGMFFFCFSSAVTSFYRHKERIELTGGLSVASRSKRRPAWTPRTSLHARWLLWGARLGVVEEELLPSPVPP